MRRTGTLLLLCAAATMAQDPLSLNQTQARDLEPGNPHSYIISLSAGDYAGGSLESKVAGLEMVVSAPDGSLFRTFTLPADIKQDFSFSAEAAGTYKLELRATAAGKYELRWNEKLSLDERLRPAEPKDKYSSPRIEALRKQIAAGDISTGAFWKQVADEHTPLFEKPEKDERNQLVTFLWRDNAAVRNVLVLWFPFTLARPQDYAMSHLANTDVWYVTVKAPRGARFAYQLSPNDPLTFEGPRSSQRGATAQMDPLNPNRWLCASNATKFACQSMAEAPDAPPQPWILHKDGTPAGEVSKHKIKSDLLKNEHNLSVYTPPGYRADGSAYPLLVVFDEGAYLQQVPTPTILDNLIAASKIPPMVAVLIANPSQATRSKELPPNPDFADFLAKELISWTHARYNVTSDPRLTVVAGSSYGGIASTYAGLRHPEVFGNILCQSGSFWWAPDHNLTPDADPYSEGGWLAKQFIQSPKLPLRFYMDAGTFEQDLSGGGNGILEPSRHMRDVLLAKGYEVHYQQFVGGHDYISWRGTLADGLIELIGKPEATTTR